MVDDLNTFIIKFLFWYIILYKPSFELFPVFPITAHSSNCSPPGKGRNSGINIFRNSLLLKIWMKIAHRFIFDNFFENEDSQRHEYSVVETWKDTDSFEAVFKIFKFTSLQIYLVCLELPLSRWIKTSNRTLGNNWKRI